MRVAWIAIFLLLPVPSVQALELADGLRLTVPPDGVKCVDIVLPDHLGSFEPGPRAYLVTADAPWGNLRELEVTTDENNTVVVPLCLFSSGVANGSCADYAVTLATLDGKARKSFAGGACVSGIEGAGLGEGGTGEVLNGELSLFALVFQPATLYGGGGTLTLQVQSEASLALRLEAEGLEPAQQTVSLSPETPRLTLNYTASSPGEVRVRATIQGCQGRFCEQQATARVLAGDPPSRAGFTTSLFPLSLSAKAGDTVSYELAIENYGDAAPFEVSLLLPAGVSSPFQPQQLALAKGERTSLAFEVTATGSEFYEIVAEVASRGNAKKKTAFLAVDEQVADARRQLERVAENNPAGLPEAQQSFDSWYASYQFTPLGEGLDDYSSLQEELEVSAALPEGPAPQPRESPPAQPIPAPQEFPLLLAVGAGAVVAVLLAFVLLRRRKPARQLDVPPLEQ
ncbi:MAG: hypothetical protein HY520_04660 [Candidatus Aenigmarchaeota archaeon]|nr:hypothetical protein [Candidatus Aenigmarchaeota archaeon]